MLPVMQYLSYLVSFRMAIRLADRVFNKAEKNCSTTHRDFLAVVFGLQVHRCCHRENSKFLQTMQYSNGSLQ